jgi:hypothetical protein
MEKLIISGTEDTPNVVLNPQENQYILSGRSLPEDVTSFYQPVMDWIEQYAENPFPMTLETKLEYFNTASSKVILDIFMRLEEIKQDSDCDIQIKWFFDENDEDMEEAGEEYKELVEDLTFTLHPY